MLSIGPLQFDMPVIQAALAGYSDLAMRRIARAHGAPYAINEVVLDRLVLTKGKGRRRVLRVAPDDHPVGAQLMGAVPEDFAEAAHLLVEAGYDVLDINFGCPVRKVLGRGRGGFLLSRPKVALEIVQRVCDAVGDRVPVTVKLRSGMDDSSESERSFFEILDGSFARGVTAVTVHPRTVRQRYIGPSRWDFLARVKKHVGDRLVLGSGDLFTPQSVLRMFAETGVDGVTLARGCIGNPWIFAQCRALLAGRELPPPPTVVEQGATIDRHHRYVEELYGSKVAARLMRKFTIHYAALHPFADEVRADFLRTGTPEQWRATMGKWYSADRDWPPTTHRHSQPDLVAAGACGPGQLPDMAW
jgi:nifR3 family TIM-barrel protein